MCFASRCNDGRPAISTRAEYAPFEAKDILKNRGYSWKDGSDGGVQGWEAEIPIGKAEDERAWLVAEVYNGKPKYSEKSKNSITRFTPDS